MTELTDGQQGAGRSPRVRGSRSHVADHDPGSGSIPACAGEPSTTNTVPSVIRVDPRVCGGAKATVNSSSVCAGRSPRVRGSLPGTIEVRDVSGSIPACAGEPRRPLRRSSMPWVDPRVCGGATWIRSSFMAMTGRSPRVRGSLCQFIEAHGPDGSIPACAGEPQSTYSGCLPVWVDPRVCGGALHALPAIFKYSGRSPRVRGSHLKLQEITGKVGSIPACAGEPRSCYQDGQE